MQEFATGVYEYKGKEYYVANTTRRGTGQHKGLRFVSYMALYPCEGGREFVRELADFEAKFKYVRTFI